MGEMDADVPDHRAAARDHGHAGVLVPGPAHVALREAAPSLAAVRSRRMDRNRRKSLALVLVRTNLAITASRNHAPDHRNEIGTSQDLARGHARSHTLAHVPSPRTTNPARVLDLGRAHRAPIRDPVIVRNRQTSPMTSLDRHHQKITITLRSVMKAWKIKQHDCVEDNLTVPKITTFCRTYTFF